mmetsp:Transcript_36267/g.40478  ORF Transcript_36267/g.40478 Transcript_36267/m.40478 type:complete len:90 (-) Transcript_36267:320-589(-)
MEMEMEATEYFLRQDISQMMVHAHAAMHLPSIDSNNTRTKTTSHYYPSALIRFLTKLHLIDTTDEIGENLLLLHPHQPHTYTYPIYHPQ